jgi:protoheme IX farnesyltransferase
MSSIGTDVLASRAPAAARISPRWSVACRRAALYSELTKPGISVFVALSAAAGYVLSSGAATSWPGLLLVMLCTTLMSAGAATQNQVIECGRDRMMRRTAARPVAAGLIPAVDAGLFGWALTFAGLLLALATLPPLVAAFLVLSHVSYVNIYTPMKLRTPLCTLAGAFPGAFPVLAGAAAGANGIDLSTWLLTGVLFAWQLPHFMAIGWLAREDYARGGYAMLFLRENTGRDSAIVAVLYAVAMAGCALLLAWAASTTPVFTTIAAACSATYITLALAFLRVRERLRARRLFFSSIMILPVILLTLVVELLVLR